MLCGAVEYAAKTENGKVSRVNIELYDEAVRADVVLSNGQQ